MTSGSRLGLGQVGKIRIKRLATGRYQAEAYRRTWKGDRLRVRATGTTAESAELALRKKIQVRSTSAALTQTSTVDDLAANWVNTMVVENRKRQSTIEAYERDIQSLISPALGKVLLGECDTPLLETFIMGLMEHSPSGARRARTALLQMFRRAERLGVVAPNPVIPTTVPPRDTKEVIALNSLDLRIVRSALTAWESDTRNFRGSTSDRLLSDTIEVMLGSGIRIGELLALRNKHVSIQKIPESNEVKVTLDVVSSMSYTKKNGYSIQELLKNNKQRRTLTLPGYARDVVLRRYSPDRSPDDLLFPSATGTPIWTHNYRRKLRKFLQQAPLPGLSVDPKDISPHTFRKTVATLLAENLNVEKAAELLGHASVAITENHYWKRMGNVDPITAEVLQEHFAILAED